MGQPYCTDSTNLTDDYTRNRIRHDILPRLCELNPNFTGAMARMLPRLAAQQALTDCLAAQSAQQLQAACGGLSRQGLSALPEPVCDRLLLRLLEQNRLPVSAAASTSAPRVPAREPMPPTPWLSASSVRSAGRLSKYSWCTLLGVKQSLSAYSTFSAGIPAGK